MPREQRGAEQEFAAEGREDKNKEYREAWDKLQEIMESYNADPAQIPVDQLGEFKAAAEHYISISEDPNELRLDIGIKNLAEQVLKESEAAGL